MPGCKLCKERGKTWKGGDPRCAFPPNPENTHQFVEYNWMCATVQALRDIAYEDQDKWDDAQVRFHYKDDQTSVIFPIVKAMEIDGKVVYLFMSWYKRRGQTDSMYLLLEEDPPRRPTEWECLQIIEHYREKSEQKCSSPSKG